MVLVLMNVRPAEPSVMRCQIIEPIVPFNIKKPLPQGRFVGVSRNGEVELLRKVVGSDFEAYTRSEEILADFMHRSRLID